MSSQVVPPSARAVALVLMAAFLACATPPKTPAASPSSPQVQDQAPRASVASPASPPAQAVAEKPLPNDARRRPPKRPLIVLSLPEPALPGPGKASLASTAAPLAAAPLAAAPLAPAPSLPQASPAPAPAPVLPPPAVPAKPAAPVPAPAPAKASDPAPAKASAPAPAKPESPAPKPAAAKPEAAAKPSPTQAPTPTPPSTALSVQPLAERKPDIARSVTVELGSRVELPFDGTGWTYLGESQGRDGILYESRRYEGSGLIFVLNTVKVGDFVLRFQRQDTLRGSTNEELVAVRVSPKTTKTLAPGPAAPGTAASGQASSPSTPGTSPAIGASPATSAGPTAGAAPASTPATASTPALTSGAASGAAPGTAPSPASTSGLASASPAAPSSGAASPQPGSSASLGPSALTPPPATAAFAASLPNSPDALLLAARSELTAGRIGRSLAALDRFLSLYPEGMDEVYYLYGVALEQNGDYKDVKRAYGSYKKVIDDYPESQFWDQASQRMAYLERHYFSIR